MKKLILPVIIVLISSQNSFALNSSSSEMEYKKEKALRCHDDYNKLYGNTASREISFLKDKALRWYGNYVSTFTNETNSLKRKSFRWHEDNNK